MTTVKSNGIYNYKKAAHKIMRAAFFIASEKGFYRF